MMRRISVFVGRCGSVRCLAMLKVLEIGADGPFQPCRFRKLFFQLSDEARHLLLEWFTFVLHFFSTDIATRSQHVAMLRDLVCPCGLTEAGNVSVFANV